jgi:hypothetical protein
MGTFALHPFGGDDTMPFMLLHELFLARRGLQVPAPRRFV